MKRSWLGMAAALVLGGGLLVGCSSGSKTTVVTGGSQQTGISVSGQGMVYGTPDVVDIMLGVQAQSRNVADARQTAAQAQQAVIDSLKSNGVADADIKTVQFSIDPRYTTNNSTGTQTLTGYQVTNVLTARVHKIDTAGKVIDDATAAGGNSTVVRSITYSIADPSKLQEQARDAAVKDAEARAKALAQQAGVSLGKATSITEGSGAVSPALQAPVASAAFADVSTPLQAGQQQVRVTVNVVYAID